MFKIVECFPSWPRTGRQQKNMVGQRCILLETSYEEHMQKNSSQVSILYKPTPVGDTTTIDKNFISALRAALFVCALRSVSLYTTQKADDRNDD